MTDHHYGSAQMHVRRRRRQRFGLWAEQLRRSDVRFGEAAARHGDEALGWQAAVYLLTGCDVVWGRLGARVLADGSLQCVDDALGRAESWTPRQLEMLRWAAHLCDPERHDAGGVPAAFGQYCFNRWVTALHLRQGNSPALTIVEARRTR